MFKKGSKKATINDNTSFDGKKEAPGLKTEIIDWMKQKHEGEKKPTATYDIHEDGNTVAEVMHFMNDIEEFIKQKTKNPHIETIEIIFNLDNGKHMRTRYNLSK